MSLSSYEASRFSGDPVNLYLFKYGVGQASYFGYTDAEETVNFGGNDYQPIPIDRGKLKSTASIDKSTLTVTTEQDSELAGLYLNYPPSSVTTLVIYQGHVDDPDRDYRVVWSGIVTSCSRKGSQAEFSCKPISTMLQRNGCRRRYQYGCPHVLYSQGDGLCNASKVDATVTTTVQSINGARVILPNGWWGQRGADKFLQGMVEWIGLNGNIETRTILRVESGGLRLLLSGPATGLGPGALLNVVLGCNHKSGTDAQPDGDCGPLHNNVLNFGGQERIPLTNPIGLVNYYY
jgi:hypothetical protein